MAQHDALDHLEEEIRSLEGVTRWGRSIRIVALVVFLVAGIVGIAWFVTSPPGITSARLSYAPSTGSPIEVEEPKGVTLTDPPIRFAWESVTGRLQYVVRIYVKGSTTTIFERMLTSPSIELTPDERARLHHGNSFVWTIGAGQSTFRVR